jgi:hypothetical protein
MKLECQRCDGKRCVPQPQPVAPQKLQIPGQTACPDEYADLTLVFWNICT